MYRYNIDDFKDIPFVAEDIDAFYKAHDAYIDNKGDRSKLVDFEIKGRELYISAKHREVEGFITQAKRDEIWEHVRDVLDDLNEE